jgi:outer membrane protein TolC
MTLFSTSFLYASSASLSLSEAIEILKSENLEIKNASLDLNSAKEDAKTASGNHWGKLDFIQDFATSDDAGNVFGFKLTSREANFNDFGFDEFLAQMGGLPGNTQELLNTQPNNLNYPDSRNFFQSKLKYEIPLFTGFKISSYVDIMNSMTKIKKLDKEQVINEKIYQIRKSFYDMALLRQSAKNLNVILQNITVLEDMTNNMIEVGYAKKVDLLEVTAKKGNVERLVAQMESNQKLLYHYISFLLNQKITDIQTPSSDIVVPPYSNEEILNNNLDIQKANNGLDIRKSMINVSEASYYPMIGAFAEVATADNTFLGDASDHKSYTLGARLTWNIFNGGIDGANLEKSRIEHLKTKTQVQLAKSGIELNIEKIRTEIQTYDNDILSLQKELALADEIYKNYEGRYKEKLSSMSDVIIKQSEQIQKILQLQQVKNKRNERIFALEKLANGEQQ